MTMMNDTVVACLLSAERQPDLTSSGLAGVYHDHAVRRSVVSAEHDTATHKQTTQTELCI